MKYASVCSGVEAPTVAWKDLGWEAVWFSQYDPEHNYKNGPDFPSSVLAHHYSSTPNLGDMTKLRERDEYRKTSFDLLIGGTPCQSFSVAGLRKGLQDERGNLALEFCRILDEKKPKWFVWENVPGVLSSNKGKDFECIIKAFTEIGYGVSWRILDAQYFGVPQRRRRVFVVGCFGDWRSSAKVLFEQESLLRNPKESSKKKQENPRIIRKSSVITVRTANTKSNGIGISHDDLSYTLDQVNGQAVFAPKINACLETTSHDYSRADGFTSIIHATQDPCVSNRAFALGRNNGQENALFVQNSRDEVRFQNGDGQISGALSAQPGAKQQDYVLFEPRSADGVPRSADGVPRIHDSICPTLNTMQGGQREPCISRGLRVRKLTPVECERLQGFPDNYTKIPYRNKSANDCPDGHRYKAMGNSMAVPVIKWLGERIEFESSISSTTREG